MGKFRAIVSDHAWGAAGIEGIYYNNLGQILFKLTLDYIAELELLIINNVSLVSSNSRSIFIHGQNVIASIISLKR